MISKKKKTKTYRVITIKTNRNSSFCSKKVIPGSGKIFNTALSRALKSAFVGRGKFEHFNLKKSIILYHSPSHLCKATFFKKNLNTPVGTKREPFDGLKLVRCWF